jgi:hypothetical protein
MLMLTGWHWHLANESQSKFVTARRRHQQASRLRSPDSEAGGKSLNL